MTTAKLTEAEFEAHDSRLSTELRATKRGTPERASAEARLAAWEAAIALPEGTVDQRRVRHETIARVAAAQS